MKPNTQQIESSVPLCVDLDGTLVKSDSLFECALQLLKSNPLMLFQMLIWLSRGKAVLKSEITARVRLSSQLFPYNEELLAFVKQSRINRKTVLVTGADQRIADFVAEDTGLFDEVQGSDGKINLTSSNKRDWLVSRFGEKGFDYIGNDKDDIAVWAEAHHALLVGDESLKAAFGSTSFSQVFHTAKPSLKDFLSLLRVHQWSKNTLIFIPFLLDKSTHSWSTLFIVVVSFIAMSLLASMTYIANDMLDLADDRLNKTKKRRALASCRIPLETGIRVAALLFVAVLVLSLMLPWELNGVLLLYFATTLWYSFHLKRVLILDVCAIAVLHTFRIVAGIFAVHAAWSFWLLAFSMFIFFSLATAKRVSELSNLRDEGRSPSGSRGYQIADIPMLSAIGVSTGFLSVLVVALFVNSEHVAMNYSQPMLLWLLCPLLMYWIGRLWVFTSRGELHEDPIVFAMRDHVSKWVTVCIVVVVALASFL